MKGHASKDIVPMVDLTEWDNPKIKSPQGKYSRTTTPGGSFQYWKAIARTRKLSLSGKEIRDKIIKLYSNNRYAQQMKSLQVGDK